MLHRIEDEIGQVWWIGKGDPACPDVQKLHSRRYTRIVLPRNLIQCGWHGWRSPLGDEWKEALRDARRIGYNTDRGRRHIRLAECLKVLED